MKIWIARDSAKIPDDMTHYIERHPENIIEYADLNVFYDKPIWDNNNGSWGCARKMGKPNNFMFPEIKCGECFEFNSVKE